MLGALELPARRASLLRAGTGGAHRTKSERCGARSGRARLLKTDAAAGAGELVRIRVRVLNQKEHALCIRTLAGRTIIAASGHGRQRGECECESGAMSLVSGSWIGWVWWLVWWWGAMALAGGERGVTGVRREARAGVSRVRRGAADLDR